MLAPPQGGAEEQIVSGTNSIPASAAAAFDEGRMSAFVAQSVENPSFWSWMNSPQIDMRLFFAAAREAPEETLVRHLEGGRSLLAREYSIASRHSARERRPPAFGKLDAIRSRLGPTPPKTTAASTAARDLLSRSDPARLLDPSHEAVIYYHLLDAIRRREFEDAVIAALAVNPGYLDNPALVSTVAQAAGPDLIRLVAKACLASGTPDSTALESITPLPRQSAEDVRAYAERVLSWFRSNSGRLKLNSDALYPAPPFATLFEISQ